MCAVKLISRARRGRCVAAADKELAKFETNYQTALKQARTIVIDTGTELWELLRLAEFGKLAAVLPHQYAAVNQQMTRLIKLAYDSDANLLITHKLKAQWIGDKKTDVYEFAGMKDVPFLVQAHARMWRDDDGFHLRVGKCRQNAMIAGLELVNEMINFPTLAGFVFPDSEPERLGVMTEKPYMCPQCGNDIPQRLIELRTPNGEVLFNDIAIPWDADIANEVIGWQCLDCGEVIDRDEDK